MIQPLLETFFSIIGGPWKWQNGQVKTGVATLTTTAGCAANVAAGGGAAD
jgi:hypothetical protein